MPQIPYNSLLEGSLCFFEILKPETEQSIAGCLTIFY